MLAAICPAQPRDIVAKDQIVYRILLSLYFTIFLNQLDNLFPYTENGTIRPRSGLIGDSFSWLVEEIVMFGRVSADGFSRLLARHSSKGGGLVACAAAMPLAVLALAVTADYDLPLNFHPAAIRASAGFTPLGAGGATCDRRSWSGLRRRSRVAERWAA
jgi:hypothetical protein